MKKILSIFSFAILMSQAVAVKALDLQAELGNMFQSNVTQAGQFNSATRGGWVGGGISLRTPIKPINLVSFDPPRLSAGCGGIDMYMGSFTFINKDQIVALFRQIMNNAVGLLFKAALKNISPSIDNLISEFQKIVADLNALASNTCAIANSMIKSVSEGSVLNDLNEAKTKVAGVTGAVGSMFDSKNPKDKATDKSQLQQTEKDNPAAGNYVWRALSRSQAADGMGTALDPTDPNSHKAKYLLISLIGSQSLSAFNDTSTDPPKPQIYGKKLSLQDLLYGGQLKIWACDSSKPGLNGEAYDGPNGCIDMLDVDYDYSGTLNYTHNMLYGDSTKTTKTDIATALNSYLPSSPGPNSILGRVLTPAAGGGPNLLSAKERYFLTVAGPILSLIKNSQHQKESMERWVNLVSNPIAVLMTINIGKSALKSGYAAFDRVHGVDMQPEYKNGLSVLKSEIDNMEAQYASVKNDLENAKKITDELRASLKIAGGK